MTIRVFAASVSVTLLMCVGCISAESIKAQMTTDKQGAFQSIMRVVEHHALPTSQCLELAEMLDEDQKCLLIQKLARKSSDQYRPADADYPILLGMLSNVDGSQARLADKNGTKDISSDDSCAEPYALRVVRILADSMAVEYNDEVQSQTKRIMCTFKDPQILLELEGVRFAYKNWGGVGAEIENKLIPMQLVKALKSQEDVKKFLLGQYDGRRHDEEVEDFALNIITNQDVLLSLLGEDRFKDKVLGRFDEKTITKYLAGNPKVESFGDCNAYLSIIKNIKDQKLIALILLQFSNIINGGMDYGGRVAKLITDPSVKTMAIKSLVAQWQDGDEGEYTCYRLLCLAHTQDDLLKVANGMRGKKVWIHQLENMVDQVTDAKVADALYDSMPMYFEDGDGISRMPGVIKSIVAKMSAEKKSAIVKDVAAKIKDVKGVVVFDAFWSGMSCGEFYVMADKLGINASAEIKWMPDRKKTMRWHGEYPVESMSFPVGAAAKHMDCEDAVALQQLIKTFVMKESGKAETWDYAGKIDLDSSFDAKEKIDLFSPTGTRVDVKSEFWSTYKNSKLGFSARLGKKCQLLVIRTNHD